MKKIYILSGEEIILKEDFIKDLLKDKKEWNYKKIVVDNNKKEAIGYIVNDSFMYLTTIDMFNFNNKVLHIVIDNAKTALEILTEIKEFVDKNILIMDIRNTDVRSLTSSSFYKKVSSDIELKKYVKLEEKDRTSTINNIYSYFKEYNINFESKEVEKMCAIYLYENSDYSYTVIRQYLEQMRYFSNRVLTKEDVYELIASSFNGNFFVLVSKIFSVSNKRELMNLIDDNFSNFTSSDYISFLNIFIYTLKDYIRYESGVKCKNISNYYQFRNSKFKINDVSKFILEISNINLSLRISTKNIKEDLLLCFWNYINEK